MTTVDQIPAQVKEHPKLRGKADAMVRLLKPGCTVDALEALTDAQWQALGERAGVGKPSPLVRSIVREQVAEMRAVVDG